MSRNRIEIRIIPGGSWSSGLSAEQSLSNEVSPEAVHARTGDAK